MTRDGLALIARMPIATLSRTCLRGVDVALR